MRARVCVCARIRVKFTGKRLRGCECVACGDNSVRNVKSNFYPCDDRKKGRGSFFSRETAFNPIKKSHPKKNIFFFFFFFVAKKAF